ncbi:unnamed protein product [marine sediment metagenome]|uniref:Peptidoglycan binding-like domain-containing protein n=1 Tax=marine sediment metagenome TaxID=412755 RepID=X1JWD6_9ZZZZ
MPEIKTVLTKESEGYEVAYLQSLLKVLGYRETDPNGVFNLDTEHHVKSFQADAGLSINGVVDEATWQALEDEVAGLSKVGVKIPYLDIEIPWWGCAIIGAIAGGLIVGLIVRRR